MKSTNTNRMGVSALTATLEAKQRQKCQNKQAGFTLVEILIVVAIIGILIMLVAPRLLGSSDGAKAMNLYTAADRLNTNWRTVNEVCGTSKVVGTSPITTTASTAAHLQFLVDGTGMNGLYFHLYMGE